jgi:sec-independent protein translocase protein TatA
MVTTMFASLPSLAFLDVGGTELMMIMLVILLLFGSKRMPDLARGIGKTIREFRKATSGLEEELRRAIETPPSPPQPRKPAAPPGMPPSPIIVPQHPPVETPRPPDEHHYP